MSMTNLLQPKRVLFCQDKAFDDFQRHLGSHKEKHRVERGFKRNTNLRQNYEKNGQFMYYGTLVWQYLGQMGPNSNFYEHQTTVHLKKLENRVFEGFVDW